MAIAIVVPYLCAFSTARAGSSDEERELMFANLFVQYCTCAAYYRIKQKCTEELNPIGLSDIIDGYKENLCLAIAYANIIADNNSIASSEEGSGQDIATSRANTELDHLMLEMNSNCQRAPVLDDKYQEPCDHILADPLPVIHSQLGVQCF